MNLNYSQEHRAFARRSRPSCRKTPITSRNVRRESPDARGAGLAGAADRERLRGADDSEEVVKLQACEINHQLAALAVDALGEHGLLYRDSPLRRSHGAWQARFMFDLAMIVGGGTAQIQKNIIAERSRGMPREPRLAKAE